jgi:hypothetical protein
MSASEFQEISAHRLRWYQYTLRSLFVLITLAAVVCTYYVNYRRTAATANVTYRIFLVNAGALEPVVGKHTGVRVQQSPFVWVILDDRELESLVDNKQATRPLRSNMRVISIWPKQADSFAYTFSRQVPVSVDGRLMNTFPISEVGGLAGFPGVCRIGLNNYRLRLEYNVNHQGPADETPTVAPVNPTKLSGKLFYEGPAPDGHLVFFARFGEGRYYVVVFDANPIR